MNENELYFSIFPNERFIDLGLYQFGMEQCQPSHLYGPAARNHFLFHYIISGTGTLYADDSTGTTRTYHLKSGEGFLIFPNQITTYIADKELPWEYVWVEFDGLRAKEAMDTAGFSLDRPIFHTKKRDISKKMEEELVYIATHSDAPIFNIIGHLYLFLDYFMRATASTVIKGNTKLQDYYIKEAITYIEQNFQNDISIVDIANRLGINRSYFGKIFKQTLKQTPQEFLINYRMIKATELLKLTKMSIGDISKAVGYENQLHFSRAFKKIYNISPREWRNANTIKL